MRCKFWTQEEIDLLVALYPDHSNGEIVRKIKKTKKSVQAKAFLLGLKKSKEYTAAYKRKGQFKKGHKPFNKGKNMSEYCSPEVVEKMKKTQFKKGQKPQNTSPLGYECIRPDKSGRSYIYVKAHEDKPMILKQRYIWEKAYGPIPKGCAIVFKDGNSLNVTLENLICLTRGGLAVRNSIHNYPEELKKTIKLKNKIVKKIAKSKT
ncbi:MAG: HNH endonuclease [Chitinophagales bacterium]|jgi:hypothetical protein|nr:HNH endonuclease [Chitinophagales bacterium]